MRKITMFENVSADGYFAGPDGKLDWVVQDPEQQASAAAATAANDTVLFGRKTYEQFATFWPHALDDDKSTPTVRALAKFFNDATKLVFSKTLKEAPWRGTRIMPVLDPRAIVAMKEQPGKDILIFGSGSIVAQLTEHHLIDEYQLVVSPVLLGRGRAWLPDVDKRVKLDLVESHWFPTGTVRLRYLRAH